MYEYEGTWRVEMAFYISASKMDAGKEVNAKHEQLLRFAETVLWIVGLAALVIYSLRLAKVSGQFSQTYG